MTASPLPPSVYVSRLRRAFFLRVHPDRFRAHEASVRQRQARLVQALNDRMSNSADFLAYNYGGRVSTAPITNKYGGNTTASVLSYVLEHRDGRLLQKSLRLDDTVENILHNIRQALIESGAASLPPPPKVKYYENNNNKNSGNKNNQDDTMWASNDGTNSNNQNSSKNGIHRDLVSFCSALDRQQVEDRRQSRMDANTAAMMGRRLYQFQSVDGTSLHWSSQSFAILMTSLIELHEEHGSKFHVESFYPLRLVFSSHDFDSKEEAVDLFGGVVHLSPGYTPIQWLDILQQVTPERLELLQQNRAAMEQAQRKIQSALGVRFQKGYTCSSHDYYHFVLGFAHHLRGATGSSSHNAAGMIPATTSVALESIQVTVESADACRFRTVITNEGNIRVGVGMSVDKVLSAIYKDSDPARQRREQDRKERAISDEQARQVQWELGLTRKVFKAGIVRIRHDEFQQCLQRIVNLDPEQKGHLKLSLSGNALGVAGSGQFCHLGDDGAIIVPHDWSIQGQETQASSTFSSM